jgi:predicted GNAT family N-acyltransferase
MKLLEIEFGSDAYKKECKLRNEVMRIPLGLNLFNEDLSLESKQQHFGMFDENERLIACAVAVVYPPNKAKIRQMAVATEHQGRGFGRELIHFIETKLAHQGITLLQLHARKTAVRFYEKLGYVRVGQEFEEVGVPHIKMEKNS